MTTQKSTLVQYMNNIEAHNQNADAHAIRTDIASIKFGLDKVSTPIIGNYRGMPIGVIDGSSVYLLDNGVFGEFRDRTLPFIEMTIDEVAIKYGHAKIYKALEDTLRERAKQCADSKALHDERSALIARSSWHGMSDS